MVTCSLRVAQLLDEDPQPLEDPQSGEVQPDPQEGVPQSGLVQFGEQSGLQSEIDEPQLLEVVAQLFVPSTQSPKAVLSVAQSSLSPQVMSGPQSSIAAALAIINIVVARQVVAVQPSKADRNWYCRAYFR